MDSIDICHVQDSTFCLSFPNGERVCVKLVTLLRSPVIANVLRAFVEEEGCLSGVLHAPAELVYNWLCWVQSIEGGEEDQKPLRMLKRSETVVLALEVCYYLALENPCFSCGRYSCEARVFIPQDVCGELARDESYIVLSSNESRLIVIREVT
jgi:hypothetical protein